MDVWVWVWADCNDVRHSCYICCAHVPPSHLCVAHAATATATVVAELLSS